MAKYQRIPRGKTINPTFIVFCEGESEDAYISFLRSRYRIPIQIVSRIARNRINQKYVNKHLRLYPHHEKDKLFLMYDLAAPAIMEKLQEINKAVLLVSNPCFEVWYILHFVNQFSEITSQRCIEKLEGICKDYRKGVICGKLRENLDRNIDRAVVKAKKLPPRLNPSTSIYLLVDELTKFKTGI
mgnify:CR=1 FL=1